MPHFEDHTMSTEDVRALLKKMNTNVVDARTRFVRTIPALKGLYEETTDPLLQEKIEVLMARLAFIIDAIDGKVLPHDATASNEEMTDEELLSNITQSHVDRWLSDNAE